MGIVVGSIWNFCLLVCFVVWVVLSVYDIALFRDILLLF